MTIYTWGWIGWGVYFLAFEIPALLNKQEGDTLSEHIWAWFAVKGGGRFGKLRRIILAASLSVLFLHFLTGGKF